MIWDDGDDELLDDPAGASSSSPEPTLAHGDDSWRPVPKPPLYAGPFEIVAEETHASGTPVARAGRRHAGW